ncbi:hypothetical protein SDRG_08028 [Saprolegnia diclina VS20]|uniref:Protein kinase domain-containing protein n=1 Tax=Saprolegnia diclina (strain VS20) TaxID=1156394 RepID=T0RWI6_SAPDV|nr:hypothetical protein SDRG_08028 [Saprolegnia diclina VS20]EQC34712.1 hypothetical protein SDRG_08028 [Saprolegnia diclina VS20]|eukprot:XP_008612118.1 hypothetical protein SDRG_08028 [Saprolegnia diclina VS20]
MCMSLHHPNIVPFYGVSSDTTSVSFITEKPERGSLANALANDTNTLSALERLCILLDVARGMQYLHSKPVPVLHRDLRAANINLSYVA